MSIPTLGVSQNLGHEATPMYIYMGADVKHTSQVTDLHTCIFSGSNPHSPNKPANLLMQSEESAWRPVYLVVEINGVVIEQV